MLYATISPSLHYVTTIIVKGQHRSRNSWHFDNPDVCWWTDIV